MKWFRSRDPRLALAWHRLPLPTGEVRLVTPFDAAKDRTGLGVRDGVQSYRDGLGRRFQVPVAYFTAKAVKLSSAEAAQALPPLDPDIARLRFGLAPEGLARVWPRAKPVAVRAPGKSRASQPAGKPRPGPAKPATQVEIRLLRRARKLETGVE